MSANDGHARDSIEMSELRLEVIRSEIQVQKVI